MQGAAGVGVPMVQGVPIDYVFGFLPDDRRAALAAILSWDGAQASS